MKKTMLSRVVPALFGLAMLASQSALAADDITFNGTVISPTCPVTGGAGTTNPISTTGGKVIRVALPPVNINQLSIDGQTAGDTRFNVQFGSPGDANCTNGKIASLWIDPKVGGVSATGTIQNSGSAGLNTNAQVRLLNGDNGLFIDLRNGNNMPAAIIANGTATLNFIAQYLAAGGPATSGKFINAVFYTVQYN